MVGIKIVRGNTFVLQVVGMSSSINMQINADRLHHAPSPKKHQAIEVGTETHTDYFGRPYKIKVIKEIDNQDQVIL